MRSALLLSILILFSSGCSEKGGEVRLTFAGGGVGAEEEVTRRQLERFESLHPGIRVRHHLMPSSSTEQHDIYVTYLSAADPSLDVLTLDVIWPAEFAAAGWILPLDGLLSKAERDDFFPSTLAACTYRGRLYALPLFSAAGALYYRKDLLRDAGLSPPETWKELEESAERISREREIEGFLWQGAQYEGLVCDFLEFAWSNGGGVFDREGKLALSSEENVEALQTMAGLIRKGITPRAVLTYIEEDGRQLFGDGRALYMRNWPYAWPLLQRGDSKVRGRVGVSPLPRGTKGKGGVSCLGGWNLALSAFSRHPEEAKALIRFLTAPEQQAERAVEAGQSPARKSIYLDPEVLRSNPFYEDFRDVVASSRARPSTPFYAEISEQLQIHLSRALTGKMTPGSALAKAEQEIAAILDREER